MKKLVLLTVFAFASLASAGGKSYSLSSCSGVVFENMLGSPSVEFLTEAVFPKSPQKVEYGFDDYNNEDVILNCPGIKLNKAGNRMSVQFKNKSMMEKMLFPDSYSGVSILYSSWYEYPSIRAGFDFASLSIYKGNIIKDNSYVIAKKGDVVPERFEESTAGYKINGGPLTPMVYAGKYLGFKAGPSDVIDFYSRIWEGADVVHITIDNKTGKFVFENIKSFPAK